VETGKHAAPVCAYGETVGEKVGDMGEYERERGGG